MKFYVGSSWIYPDNEKCVVLRKDNWDDWGFRTMYHAKFFDGLGQSVELGDVKIFNRHEKYTSKVLRDSFSSLDGEQFCSLGQDLDYYNNLSHLPEDVYSDILTSLNDVVYVEGVHDAFDEEVGFRDSLVRFSSALKALLEGRKLFFPNAYVEDFLKFSFSCYIGKQSHRTSFILIFSHLTSICPAE